MNDSPIALGDLVANEVDQAPHNEWTKAEVVVGRDGGSLSTGELSAPLELADDWRGVLVGFGLDPDVFEIADDTVRMSKWQQSKRTDDGDRDVIWLYSYSARFTRRPPQLADNDLEKITESIRKWKLKSHNRTTISTDVAPCTYVVNLADLQIGKSEGGGPATAVPRILAALDASVERLAWLRKRHNVESVLIANMGDPIEGCEGQYASQLFTVKLTLRAQLNLALDVLAKACDMHDADQFLAVLSNHSEWMRRGGKAVTSDSDSADGYLADTLKVLCERAGNGPTTWHIPHDEMFTTANLSGVQVAFTHGHKIPSVTRESEWLKGQSIRLLREDGVEPRIWVTAHRHHLNVTDFGPWFRFQCPSLDGGSKWFSDMSGNWNTPGLMTMLVGKHDPRGWSDVAVL